MADPQKIHPVDVETPAPTAPLVPRDYSRSDKGDPAATERYPPFRRTIPIEHLRPPKRRRSCSCCRCLCCTLLTVIILVVVVAAAVGILYLAFQPKIPKYSVDRLRVSNFTVEPDLTTHMDISVSVTARNPNKKIGIYYRGGSKLRVSYDGTNLCEGAFPEFYQGHKNTTVLTVMLTGDAKLGEGIVTALQQKTGSGSVPLRFTGDVPVRVKLGSLKLWKMTFGVRCNLVVDSLNVNNMISIKTSSCKFRKLKIF